MDAAGKSAVDRPADERKYLTVLCADIVDSTPLVAKLDPEAALARLEPALQAIRAAVRRNRGTVSREQGDGLIALFGAPRADEHHAVMACRAALELMRDIKALHDPEIQVRVGVHSGEVVAHIIEGDFTSMYEAAGPVLHFVDRLQATALPGQIQASNDCRALAEGFVTFEPSDITVLKGFNEPVRLFRVTGMGMLSRWDIRSGRELSPFVGRSSELQVLQQAAARTSSGMAQILAILGEPGTGKSRLVHEFVKGLTKTGWQCIEVECNPMVEASPRALLKELLRAAHVSIASPENLPLGSDETHSELWHAALCDVLDQPIDDRRWNVLDPLLRPRVIADAACAALSIVIDQNPTVLLIEDVHWIDSESAFAIEVMTSFVAGRPVLILLTSRSDDALRWLTRRKLDSLQLRPLDPTAVHSMLDWLVGSSTAADELRKRILLHAGGVPLFIEELVRQLAESGVIAGTRGQFELVRPLQRFAVPTTVQGVISARIDSLPSDAKALLQIASAIGRNVPLHLLAAVAGHRGATLQALVSSLNSAGLLLDLGTLNKAELRFPHDLIREVSYGAMLKEQRRTLHLKILACIEASAGDALTESVEALAYHAYQAQNWPKVETYAYRAARRCLAHSAFTDAARYFEWAIEAVEPLAPSSEREARAIDLRLEARLALASCGATARWAQLSREAEIRAQSLPDTRRKVAAAAVHAAALNFTGVALEAIEANENAVTLAQTAGAEGWQGFAEYGLGQAYCLAGRYRQAINVLDRADRRLSITWDEVLLGTTAASLRVLCCMLGAIAMVALGDPEPADLYQERALALAAGTDRLYDRIAALYSLAIVRSFQGEFAASQRAIGEAQRLARHYEVRQFMPALGCQLSNLYVQRGLFGEARQAAIEARAQAEALGHIATGMLASSYLALALQQTGDAEKAQEIARGTIGLARQQGFQWIEGQGLLALSTILAGASDGDTRDEARRCAAAALSIAQVLETKPQMAFANALLGRLLAQEGNVTSAAQALDAAIELFAAMKMAGPLERARRARGALG